MSCHWCIILVYDIDGYSAVMNNRIMLDVYLMYVLISTMPAQQMKSMFLFMISFVYLLIVLLPRISADLPF